LSYITLYLCIFEKLQNSDDNRALTLNENIVTRSSQISNLDICTYPITLLVTQSLSLLLKVLNER